MAAEEQYLTVVSFGLGKAGTNLHRNVWEGLDDYEVDVIGYDVDRERLAAAEKAGMMVVGNLAELPDALAGRELHVVDNTTASGHHAASTRAALDVLGAANITPRAWLLEKPVVSGPEERVVMDGALAEIGNRVFVNENYLASRVITPARQIIAEQRQAGNQVTDIVVDFVKDRVPNVVLDKRFTDSKGLAVFGIEMPHQLAIAASLFGRHLDVRPQSEGGALVKDVFLHDVDGIAESEGNITSFLQDDTRISLRQGLGPFDFAEDDELVRREFDWRNNEAHRTARVTFADGSELLLAFEPLGFREGLQGTPRYHSLIDYRDAKGNVVTQEVVADNTLKNLIGAVATYAATNGANRDPLLDQVTPEAVMQYNDQLFAMRHYAGEPVSVGNLDTSDDRFAATYYQSLQSQ